MSDVSTGLTKILQNTGPIKFLGCSVLNFTSQLGWGLDNSTLTVELVEDCENGDRFWARDTEIIGTAKYFDLTQWGGDFRFSGIVTSWSESKGSSGQTFSVTMQDAKQLLSGVTVMMDTYSWAPVTYYNFYNVLAKYEGLVLLGNCPDFGTARSDERGMNYQNILKALLTIGLEDQFDPQQRFACFSPTKGVTLPGTADFVIDIGWRWSKQEDRFYQQRYDALPLGPSFYKIPGTMDLLEMFNNICDLTGRNLYIDMYYDNAVSKNVIVVRCVHLVDTYAGKYDHLINEFDGGASSLSYGKELNNPKTRTMLLGENYSYLAQATNFVPCFGTYDRVMSYGGYTWNNRSPVAPPSTIAGTWLTPQGTHSNCGFWVYVDARKLNSNLYFPLVNSAGVPVDGVWISESDFKTALASEALWKQRATSARVINGQLVPDREASPPGSLNYILNYNHPYLLKLTADSLIAAMQQIVKMQELDPQVEQDYTTQFNNLQNGALWKRLPSTPQGLDLQIVKNDLYAIYNFVLDLANSHYGKTYLFRFNEKICAKWANPDINVESGELAYSAVPTNEGGWIDPGNVALGLPDPYLGQFRNDDGRIGAFALWTKGQTKGTIGDPSLAADTIDNNSGFYDGIIDIKDMSPDDYVTDGSNVWIKGQIEETVYFVRDDTDPNGYVPAGIIEFNSPAFLRTSGYNANLGAEQVLAALAALLNLEDYQKPGAGPPTPASLEEEFFYTIKSYNFVDRGKGYARGDHVTWGGDSYGKVARVGPLGEIQSIIIVNGGRISPGYHTMTVIPIISITGFGALGYGNAIAVHNSKFCGLAIPGANNGLVKNSRDTGMNQVASIDLNIKGSVSRQAITPLAAAIPMRSNNTIYGPWFSYNFFSNYGGVNVVQDKDFAPWKFGSTSLMRIAAQARAETAFESNQQPLVISENGQVTLPGLPMFSLASQLTVDGVKAGPLVNNVNVTFGDQGITSTYDFKTFSRKFGNLTQIQTEQLKLIGENRNKQLKFLRENFISNQRLFRKTKGTNRYRKAMAQQQAADKKNTSQRIILGQNISYTILNSGNPETSGLAQKTLAAMESLDKAQYEIETDYQKKALISLDGLYSPVSISGGGDAKLPRFPTYDPINIDHTKHTVAPQPPMVYNKKPINAITLTRDHMNPLTNTTNEHHHSGIAIGHNIEWVGRESEVPISGLSTNLYEQSAPLKYSNDYRFMGIRGPIVLHQWGYDTQGKPVPNRADDPSKIINSGVFATDNLTEDFYQDWLQKPNLWPAAPVDLRYDRNRGVWTAPSPYRIVVVEPDEGIGPYSTGIGRIVNSYQDPKLGIDDVYGTTLVNESGINVAETGVSLIIEDRLGSPAAAKEKQYAYFDTFSSTYLLLGAPQKIFLGKFCNQWPSIGNVKDPKNAVKEVTLYQAAKCPTGVDSCPWLLEPVTQLVNDIETPVVVEAINLFSNVAAGEYETKWCALMKNGQNYYLLSAEC